MRGRFFSKFQLLFMALLPAWKGSFDKSAETSLLIFASSFSESKLSCIPSSVFSIKLDSISFIIVFVAINFIFGVRAELSWS